MITDYLVSLHTELRMPRRRRARVLAEVEDHLLSAVAEMHADGVELELAEARAVEGFGDPGDIARGLNAVEERRHTVRAGALSLPLAFAAAWLGLRGVLGAGAPLPIALAGFVLAQVALVAGGLSAFRVWLVRRGGDPSLLVFVRRGSVLVAGCLAVVALCAATVVARHGTSLTAYAIAGAAASAALLVMCTRALRRAFAAPSPEGPDPDHDVLAELAPLIGADGVARIDRWISPRRRPWRFAAVVSLAAGLGLGLAHAVAEGGPPDLAHLPAALFAGAILLSVEALSSLAGFLVLGRWLGIRPAPKSMLGT